MADPYGRHHTAIDVDNDEETISLSFHTHTHIHNNNPFWNSSTLTLVCSGHLTWGSVTDFIYDEFKWNTFYLVASTPCRTTLYMYALSVCVCAFVFLIFAWYRLITYPLSIYTFEHHRIGSFSLFYYCNLCCGNFYGNDKARREKYFIWVCVCLHMLEYNSNWTRSLLFVVSGLGLCLYDYCNDFDWFGQSAEHWKSSYMRELIIVIVEPFFPNVCSFYPFCAVSNEMLWNRKGFVSYFVRPKFAPMDSNQQNE